MDCFFVEIYTPSFGSYMGFEFRRGKHIGHPRKLIYENGRSWRVVFLDIIFFHPSPMGLWLQHPPTSLEQLRAPAA